MNWLTGHWPLVIEMVLFLIFLGPIYAWGMIRVFRYTGNPVISVDDTRPLGIRVNPLPWAFLWPNAATMGILTVVSFVFLIWALRNDGAIAYRHYVELALVFVSAYPAMAWTDYKMRQNEAEHRAYLLRQYENEWREAEANYIAKLEQEIKRLKKTNIILERKLQDTAYLFSVYQGHFRKQQLIENDLPTRESIQ